MSSPGGYAKRLRTLDVPEGPVDGPAAGEVLAAAGDLLRRSQSAGIARDEVDGVLRKIPRASVESWLAMSHVDGLHASLARAFDEAIELALAETPDEKSAHAASALAGLAGRDRLESSMAALARYESLVGLSESGTWPRDRLKSQLADLDRAIRKRARALVALNTERRAERDLLDDATGAWWYAARSECDDLVGVFTGQAADTPHLAACLDCQRDVAAARQVDAPPGRHVSPDDLWRFEDGSMSDIEKTRVTRHAERCTDCALALQALADGERAMEELE